MRTMPCPMCRGNICAICRLPHDPDAIVERVEIYVMTESKDERENIVIVPSPPPLDYTERIDAILRMSAHPFLRIAYLMSKENSLLTLRFDNSDWKDSMEYDSGKLREIGDILMYMKEEFGAVTQGLKNEGNTCFMSSALLLICSALKPQHINIYTDVGRELMKAFLHVRGRYDNFSVKPIMKMLGFEVGETEGVGLAYERILEALNIESPEIDHIHICRLHGRILRLKSTAKIVIPKGRNYDRLRDAFTMGYSSDFVNCVECVREMKQGIEIIELEQYRELRYIKMRNSPPIIALSLPYPHENIRLTGIRIGDQWYNLVGASLHNDIKLQTSGGHYITSLTNADGWNIFNDTAQVPDINGYEPILYVFSKD